MIYNLSTHIVTEFEKRGYLPQEDKGLIIYGFFSMFSKLFYALICVVFGFLFRCILESIIFYIAFLFIKKYAGGFHASTEGRCMILSSLSILLSVCSIRFFMMYPTLEKLSLVIVPLAGVIIAFLSPVEADEKPLTDEEKKKYKIYSTLRIFTVLIAFGVLAILSYNSFSVCIGIAIILECILIVAGKYHQVHVDKMEVL